MAIIGNKLDVTAQTSLQDLQAFADAASGGKIRGEKHKDGTITLYAVNSDSSFGEKITGKAKKRQEAAQQAIQSVFAQAGADSFAGLDLVCKKSPRADALSQLIRLAGSERSDAQLSTFRKLDMPEADPTAPLQNIAADLEEIGTRLTAGAGMASWLGAIDDIAEKFAQSLTRDQKIDLALSDMSGAVRDLLASGMGAASEADLAVMEEVAQIASSRLKEATLSGKCTSDQSFTIGGKEYQIGRALGEGGFGTAYLCAAEDGSTMILKLPNSYGQGFEAEDMAEANAAMRSEYKNHQMMQRELRGMSENVLQSYGAITMPDGTIGLLSETAQGGDMDGATTKIAAALDAGRITAEQAADIRMTLAMDLFSAMAQLSDAGLAHRDIKTQNIFLSGEGQVKIADFGMSMKATTYDPSMYEIGDVASYNAPEKGHAKRLDAVQRTAGVKYNAALSTAKEEAAESLLAPNGLFGRTGSGHSTAAEALADPEIGGLFRAALMEETQIRLEDKGIDRILGADLNDALGPDHGLQNMQDLGGLLRSGDLDSIVDVKSSESFETGLAALYVLMGGDRLGGVARDSDIETHMHAWSSDPSNRALGPGSTLMLDPAADYGSMQTMEGTTGNEALDALLNEVLHPDPNQRMSLSEAAQSDVWAGVGSAATRDLLAALLSGDDAQANA